MAMQESIGAPAPLDPDPYGLPNPSGSRSSQSQHPLDDSQIEAQRLSSAAATEARLAEAEPAAKQLHADPYGLPNPSGSRSSQSQHPLDDSEIEAQPLSAATATQTVWSEAAAAAVQLRTTANLMSEAAAAAVKLRTTEKLLYSYLPLYNAGKNGDWKTATSFVGENRNLWLARITIFAETVLMVAANSFKWEFVEKLVELLTPEELAMQDAFGCTVLHALANSESVKTAEILVRKCSELTQIVPREGVTPLLVSVRRSLYKDMIWYLGLVTRLELNSPTCPFTGTLSTELFCNLICSGFNDITLYLLRQLDGHIRYPSDELKGRMLDCLSRGPWNVVIDKNSLTFIERWLYKFIHVEIGVPLHSLRNREGVPASAFPVPSRSFLCRELHCLKMLVWKASEKLVPSLKRVREAKLQHRCVEEIIEKFCIEFGSNFSFERVDFLLTPVMFSATHFGNVEIVRICLQHFPDLIFGRLQSGNKSLFHVAVEYRQEEIFNLITEIPVIRSYFANSTDNYGNTIWHSSAKLAPSSKLLSVSGAALQMQRELRWFKEVERLIEPGRKGLKNVNCKTAMEIFMEDHRKLAEEGEKWMKDTASSCMIVTTLVDTVVFAAAFTVPGGNVGDTGIPVFLQRTDFLVFAISDALALLSSSTSLLMFLSILTARYAPEDFLLKLPRRLIIGLGSLFFAIITMMVAFGATLYMLLKDRWGSFYIPIIALGCIPAVIFAKLQVPLFYDMVQSTYGSGVIKKKRTR